MNTPISLFDYDLPEAFIAQKSVDPKDHSWLLVLDRLTGKIQHKSFFEIGRFLCPGDVLVFNQTKVFKARHEARVGKRIIEVFLLREENGKWEVLLGPSRKVKLGSWIDFGAIKAELLEKKDDGVALLDFHLSKDDVLAFCEKFGEVPIPPYVEKSKETLENYQTVYAKFSGSAAAPTAGLHFTSSLLEEIKKKGVKIFKVTLHVGLGTFAPVLVDDILQHKIHQEWASIDQSTAQSLNKLKKSGKNIIAVGTTSARTLEAFTNSRRQLASGSKWVDIYIYPGYRYKFVDDLITNFHLPKSSLLFMVSALASRELVLKAYRKAIQLRYRFFSFGDAMFIRNSSTKTKSK